MLPLRTAARLLADAASLEALAPIASLLGFNAVPLALDAGLAHAAGLDAGDGRAAVATGPGALRALLVQTADGRSARAVVERLARRLAARAPHPLWLVVATAPGTGTLVLAVWDAAQSPPRVHALTVDRANVVDSDAVTMRALHAAAANPSPDGFADGTTHAAWLDLLGRDALTRRFYRELAQVVATLAAEFRTPGRASLADRRTFALLQLSRLLFLSFVEAKGWLDGDPAFLARTFERCMTSGGDYHRRVLRPLMFGTLNTPTRSRAAAARAFGRVPFLNGGLFARTPLERRLGDARWDDASMGMIFQRLLGRYRFTAREDQQRWTDAAVDPEMLGRAFESLMNAGARRESGAFYTPPALVARVTRRALASALTSTQGRGASPSAAVVEAALVEAVLDGAVPDPAEGARLLRAVRSLRLLDPACGSGAFLVHALESLAALCRRAGDDRAIAAVRRDLLATTIFGVDVNPMAVWLCELRLWLSVLIESDEPDPLRVPPLPNLDHHVRVGDALGGGGLDDATPMLAADAAALARLRGRYVRASGVAKRTLGRALDRRERAVALAGLDDAAEAVSARRLDLLAALRTRDLFGDRCPPPAGHARLLGELRAELRRLRSRRRALAGGAGLPFAFSTHFADIAADGGFGLVLGNPPWVRPHRLPPAERRRLRRIFTVAREASWRTGAELAGAGAGFAAQADLSALFVERALTLLRPGGTVSLLLPAKLWRALAGGGVRRLLLADARLTAVEDWSRSPHCFDAAVYPSLLVAVRGDRCPEPRPPSPAPGYGYGSGSDAARPGAAPPPDASAGSPPTVAPPMVAPPMVAPPMVAPPMVAPPMVRLADWRGAGERSWCAPADALPLGGEPGAPWLLLPPDARRAFESLRERGTRLADGPAGRPLLGVKSGCNEAYIFRRGADGEVVPSAEDAPAAMRALAASVEESLLRPLARGERMRPWRLEPARELLLYPHDDGGAPLANLPPGAMRWLESWRHRLEHRTDARRTRRWWSLFRTDAAACDVPRVVWADLGTAPRASMLPAGDATIPLNSCYALRCASEADALAITALLNSPPMIAWLAALAEPARGGYHRHLAWTLALLPLPAPWARARRPLAALALRARAGDLVTDEELTAVVSESHGLRPADVAPLLAWAAR